MASGCLYVLFCLILFAVSTRAQCSGTLTIASNSDVNAVSSCTTYNGDIVIASSFSGQLSLNNVSSITGDLRAINASQLTALTANRLTTIGGTFDLEQLQILSSLSMPSLNGVNRIRWIMLPSLQSLSLASSIRKANEVYITNTALADLDGIALSAVGSVDVNNNPYLATINMNDLTNATSAFSLAANGRNLDINLLSLQNATNITVRNASGLSVPALASVAGSIGLYSNYMKILAAPKLINTGSNLTILNNVLIDVSFPALQTIGSGLTLGNNTNLTSISFPQLRRIAGDVFINGSIEFFSFDSLNEVDGAARIYSTISNDNLCQYFQNLKRSSLVKGEVVCRNVTSAGGKGSTISGPGGSGGSGHSGIPGGAIAGIVVGVLALILVIAAVSFVRRRKRKQRAAAANQSPDLVNHEKPELYAGPADPTIAGPVKPKAELLTRTNNSHELHGQTSSNAPWAHSSAGYLPPELNSSQIYEANGGPLKPLAEGVNRSTDPTSSTSATTTQGSSTAPLVQESIFDDSELVEEADVAVQELGLVSVRKRALTSQAQAAGSTPTEMGGRKAEEWQELLQREKRIKARLAEIERLRGAD